VACAKRKSLSCLRGIISEPSGEKRDPTCCEEGRGIPARELRRISLPRASVPVLIDLLVFVVAVDLVFVPVLLDERFDWRFNEVSVDDSGSLRLFSMRLILKSGLGFIVG
jgi:hypothetical protein